MGMAGPLPMVVSCQTVTKRAKMARETSAARKVSERVRGCTGLGCAIYYTHFAANTHTEIRRLAPQRSLPPCGGGTGRGVATYAECADTPLPIPPPQGEREEYAARTSLQVEERACGN